MPDTVAISPRATLNSTPAATPADPAFSVLVTCGRGIVPFLREELAALRFPVKRELETGIEGQCSMADILRMNLVLRTANRVLLELCKRQVRDANALYSAVRDIPWERWIPEDGYFTIASHVSTPSIRDSRFANVKCKDAIADRFRTLTGRRPDSGNERCGVVVFLHWVNDLATLYIDTSGESLSRRGYRKIPMEAPMQEALASAVILATGWQGCGHFVNPMCGSGTLAIEAALQAQGRAPGLLRSQYGFLHLKNHDPLLWQKLRTEIRAVPKQKLAGRIIATDNRPEAVQAAIQNARTAGVEQLIEFQVCDFTETPIPPPEGVIILNPAYGERMGEITALEPVYKQIGDFFKQRCQGYRGFIFTGNLDLGKKTGLRSSRKVHFYNGSIECRLLGFELYAGSRRKCKQTPPQAE